jgi:mono/diheme cytochrome c family protein
MADMRSALRWIIRGVAAVAALVLVLVTVVYAGSEMKLRRGHELPHHAPFVGLATADSTVIARGRHLAVPIAKCVDCHGGNFAGRVFIDDPMLGRVVGPNLTRGAGGLGANLTDADYELAIRHGMDRNGHNLLFMPAIDFNRFGDEDLAALIAYVKQVPPVNDTAPASRVGPLGRALLLAGKIPLLDVASRVDQQKPHAPAPPVGATPTYGEYLAVVGGCAGCHRPNLEGGHVAGTPPNFKPAANLTPTGIGTWTEADFIRVMRQGIGPGGVQVDTFMPWPRTKDMTDTEIDALWAYLKTVPPQPIGK